MLTKYLPRIVAVLTVSIAANQGASAAEFFGLGTGPDLRGRMLSGNGSIVILENTQTGDVYRWTRQRGAENLGTPQSFTLPLLAAESSSNGPRPADISQSGDVVALYFENQARQARAFLWDEANGYTAIAPAFSLVDGGSSPWLQMSAEGDAVYMTRSANDSVLQWSATDGLVNRNLGNDRGVLFMHESDDVLVGMGSFNNFDRAFLWSPLGGTTILSEGSGAEDSWAWDISEIGEVIVGGFTFNPGLDVAHQAFRWTAETGMQPLGFLPGDNDSRARFVSDDGTTITGEGASGPFVWTQASGIQPIGAGLPGQLDEILNMSSDGSRVFFRNEAFGGEALQYVWESDGGTKPLRDFFADLGLADNMAGWQITTRNPLISDDGNTIVGRGINPNGMSDLWIAILRDPVALSGDYNNNGLVEQADLDLVLLHWGADAASAPPTWTNDLPTGAIDQDELDKVLLGWGSTSSNVGAAATAAVPEPAAIAICLFAAFSYGVRILFSRQVTGSSVLATSDPPREENPGPFAPLMRKRVFISASIFVAITSSRAPAAEFFGIVDFPGGTFDSRPRAISADGSVIVGLGNDAVGEEIFKWTRETGMVEFFPDTEGETFRFARRPASLSVLSRDGSSLVAVSPEGIVYSSPQTGRVVERSLGPANVSGTPNPILSADGSTVIGSIGGAGPYYWRIGSELTQLPPSFDPAALSRDGTVIVGDVNSDQRPAIWTPGNGLTVLDGLPGFEFSLFGNVAPDGHAAVGLATSQPGGLTDTSELFRWTAETGVQSLGELPPFPGIEHPAVGDLHISPDGNTVFASLLEGRSGIPRVLIRWNSDDGYDIYAAPDRTDGGKTPAEILRTNAMTDDAQIAVGTGRMLNPPAGPHDIRAWFWTEEEGVRWLDDVLAGDFGLADEIAGWSLTRPLISADGTTLTGRGINPSGFEETWVAILREVVALPGDYNNNGLVEQADLDLVLLHWGADAATAPPTWTNDLPTGAIDQDELDKVLLGWGNSAANFGATTAAVPEPGAWILAIAACLGYALTLTTFPLTTRIKYP